MHNRECPKCGAIGEWDWRKRRKKLQMPNGEYVLAKVPKGKGVKCPKCGHKYEPRVNEKLKRIGLIKQ